MTLPPEYAAFQNSLEEFCAFGARCADVAEINLRAARLFAGISESDVRDCLMKLDEWTALVERSTTNSLPRFRNSPEEYWNSEGCFRVLVMTTVLQRNIGLSYNLAFVEGEWDASDATNLFIHGPLQGSGGTCSTLPVIYSAIGHRLGYPISIVPTREHLFCRWEGDGELFNFEASGQGFAPRTDDYYRHWPYELTEAEVAERGLLRSLTPRELVAVFLSNGGHHLRDTMQYASSLMTFSRASRQVPEKRAFEFDWFVAMWIHRIALGISALDLPQAELARMRVDDVLARAAPTATDEQARLGLERAKREIVRILRNRNGRNRPSAPLLAA